MKSRRRVTGGGAAIAVAALAGAGWLTAMEVVGDTDRTSIAAEVQRFQATQALVKVNLPDISVEPVEHADFTNRGRLTGAIKTAWARCTSEGYESVRIISADRTPEGHYNKVQMRCRRKQ